jgi:hypothetical protein
MNRSPVTYRPESRTITDIANLYEDDKLNLEPGFQRQSVWNERDRARLIESMLRGYPLPAIFLYRREDQGRIIYDVIDGKQRIESILMFMGEMRGRFATRVQLPEADQPGWLNWNDLKRMHKQHLIEDYRIPVVEVDGEMGDIIDVFVRINSTGKALTKQEKRHARYFNSAFLREADKVARRYVPYFRDSGVLSAGQLTRMKHVELVCELMLSVHQGDVINRKAALDRVMSAEGFTAAQTRDASKQTVAALNTTRRMFPKLRSTRLKQVTDFYSLVVLIAKYQRDGMILSNRHSNRLAWDLLSAFAIQVDEVRDRQRKGMNIKAGHETARDYLLTVSQMSDDVNQRRKREAILRGFIETLFEKKDAKRTFSAEQRRILWNTTAVRKCGSCDCILTWADFTIDHVDPHSKGGRTRLENAGLMCRSCNSRKGNRRRLKR